MHTHTFKTEIGQRGLHKLVFHLLPIGLIPKQISPSSLILHPEATMQCNLFH